MTHFSFHGQPHPASVQVQDIGEQGLLRLVQQYCPSDVVGDDAAVLSLPLGQQLVVTTDILVDGVHFSDHTLSALDVGWKAVAANLSDLAAMGATPIGITVGLALPPHTPVVWVEQLYQGLTAGVQAYQTMILGGDLCRSTIATLSITALGTVVPGQVIQRSQAQPGDILVTTGVHGASKAGLELLLHPSRSVGLSMVDQDIFIRAHQRPVPRLDILGALRKAAPLSSEENPTQAYRIAGMDSSDGLADAIIQICRMSGVGAQIERSQLPIPPRFRPWLSEDEALQWCLYGGEDYELVLAMPKHTVDRVQTILGYSLFVLGEITASPEVLIVDTTGHYPAIALDLKQGFQHFQRSD